MEAKTEHKNAIPFIILNKNKTFEISKEAELYLNTLEGKKLGIVSIAGKYRTGKSYFLNKLIQRKKEKAGFEVGPTINSCTKGIWIWPETFKSENPDEEDLEVLVLDTEGFGGINENANHDNRIFIFSLLLSSMFIYNSIGSIDENALQTLSLIVNLAKNIQLGESKKGGENARGISESLVSDLSHDISILAKQTNASMLQDQTEEAIVDNFPYFLWIIRDFCLELKDAFGNPITSKLYFENALKSVGQNSNHATDGKNKIRSQIKHFFRNRDCVTMVRPVEKETDLQNLDNLEDSRLRPEFNLQIKKTRKMILMKTCAKKIKGTCLDGPKFFQLAQAYVRSINSGSAPNIENAWNYILLFENEKKLRNIYQKVRAIKSKVRNGAEVDLLLEEVFAEFQNDKIGSGEDLEEVKNKLETEIRGELEHEVNRFAETLKRTVKAKIEESLESIKRSILESDKFDVSQIEQLIDKKIHSIVERFKDQSSESEIRVLANKFFGKGKSDLLQLALKQMENEKIREKKDLEFKKLDAEKKLNDLNESVGLKIKEISKKNEVEQEQNLLLTRENQKLLMRIEQMKEEKEKVTSKLKTKELELVNFESERNENKEQEYIELQTNFEELNVKMQEVQSNGQKESVLLNGKIKYFETSIQNLKISLSAKDQEMVELKELNVEQKELIDELKTKVKTQKSMIPEGHVLIEKTKYSEMRESNTGYEDLKENYEKIIREIIEERNMIQNQFEFLKENFELEKNKNFKLLNEIHDHVLRNRVGKTGNQGEILKEENSNKENKECLSCGNKVKTRLKNEMQFKMDEENESECSKNEELSENLELSVGNVVVIKNENDENMGMQKSQVLYCVDVKTDSKSWSVQKKFRDFFDLSIKLQRVLKRVELPPSCKEMWDFVRDIWGMAGSKSFPLENRKLIIEKVIRDLAGLSVIRNHQVFQDFLKEDVFKD